ncbi:hypothetical protein [Burkholderia ubonensis]|uniref:hypothetical protein n=1 Tax=Burkholderia ubonensis TaxID=101571 RepID=UPI000A99E06E|nr:hypothetical protein [Burkholderia ubonensis]
MSEGKWTKGPWSVHAGAEYCGTRIDGPNGRGVAHAIQRDPHPTLGQGITQEEAAANGQLISASPDMAEALQIILDNVPMQSAYQVLIHEVLKKANGG